MNVTCTVGPLYPQLQIILYSFCQLIVDVEECAPKVGCPGAPELAPEEKGRDTLALPSAGPGMRRMGPQHKRCLGSRAPLFAKVQEKGLNSLQCPVRKQLRIAAHLAEQEVEKRRPAPVFLCSFSEQLAQAYFWGVSGLGTGIVMKPGKTMKDPRLMGGEIHMEYRLLRQTANICGRDQCVETLEYFPSCSIWQVRPLVCGEEGILGRANDQVSAC